MIQRKEQPTATQMFVWGSDSHGQLGLPQANIRVHNLPKQVTLLHSIKAISCGEKHIAFITQQGDVYTQGCNADGKLGIDDKSVKWSNVPVKVSLPLPATKIHCGMSHTLCLLENGDVYSWGFGEYGALGVGQFKTKFKPIKVYLEAIRTKQISAGAMHSSFLSVTGDLYMCGSNDYGQLGNPRKDKLSVPTLVPFKARFVEVSCGIFYTLMLDENGLVYAMGNNKYGQLGIGSKNPESQPTLIKTLQNEYIVKISSGYHSGALNDKGQLFLWGSGTFGEFIKPMKVRKPYPFIDLSIGGFFGCAIDNKHNVFSWGNNNSGELGLGHFQNCKQLTEVSLLRGRNIDRVYCGVNFVFAVVSPNAPSQSFNQTVPKHTRSISQNYSSRESVERLRAVQRPLYIPPSPVPRSSVQGGVRELKCTIYQLEENQRRLKAQRQQLQLKLDVLARDYEKLCAKYDMIEVVVSQKQKIIGIYENKIKDLTKNSMHQELSLQNKLIKQDNKRLTETIQRNSQLLTDKIRQKDQLILRLERSEADLLQQISLMKNQLKLSQNLLKDRLEQDRNMSYRQIKLDKDYQDIIRKKDFQIKDLRGENQNLSEQLSRLTTELLRKQQNIKTTSSKIEVLLKSKQQQQISFIKKINQLESLLKDKEIEFQALRKGFSSPRRADRQQSAIRLINEEIKLKDEAINQMRKEIKALSSLSEQKQERSSILDALRLENEQLRDQLLLKQQVIERLSQQMKNKQDSFVKLTEQYLKPNVSGDSPEIKLFMENMEKKFETTVRSKKQIESNLTRELQKEIQLSTKLKAEVDQLNFQLRRSQMELQQLRVLSLEKQKALEADLKALSSYRSTLEGKDIEAVERQYLMKTFQEDLEKTKDELIIERQALRKSQEIIKRLTDQTAQLKKILGTTEAALRVSNDQAEIFKGQIERLKKIKKDFEARQVNHVQTFEKNEQLQSKIDLVNAQLVLKTKAIRDLEKQFRQQSQASLNRQQDLNLELRKIKQAKARLASDLSQMESEKNRAVEKMQLALSESCRQKQNSVALLKKAEAAAKALELERADKQNRDNELIDTKKQLTKYRLQKEQFARNLEVLQTDYKISQKKCAEWQQKVSQFQQQFSSLQSQLQTNKDQSRRLRQQIAEANEIISQQKSINNELMNANAQFAKNQIEYVRRIEQLERYSINQQNQNEDYKPRYEALLQRNKELDERNAQLAAALNRAIQKHASEYKDRVLGDVAKNAGNIYEHLKQSAVVTSVRKKRQVHSQSQQQQSISQHLSESENKVQTQQKSPQLKKEDQYKKMMTARITDHKRRISQSALKLVDLLDVDKDSKNHLDNINQYQKINDRIESIQLQKSNLLTKINNYAEKLKIL